MSNVCSNLPACSTRTTRNALSPEATERHDSTYELSRACSYIWPGPTRSTRPMSAVPSRGWKSISWCQVMVSATAVTRPANPRWRASSNSSASVRSAKEVAREKEGRSIGRRMSANRVGVCRYWTANRLDRTPLTSIHSRVHTPCIHDGGGTGSSRGLGEPEHACPARSPNRTTRRRCYADVSMCLSVHDEVMPDPDRRPPPPRHHLPYQLPLPDYSLGQRTRHHSSARLRQPPQVRIAHERQPPAVGRPGRHVDRPLPTVQIRDDARASPTPPSRHHAQVDALIERMVAGRDVLHE